MRSYIHPVLKGILCLFLIFYTLGARAQSGLGALSDSAIEAGFDNDIFVQKIVKKSKVSTRYVTKSKATDMVASYDALKEKGPKTNTSILHETRVESYNENSYAAPVPEGYDGYKIQILHTMEPIQDNNPVFFKYGCISEEQLNDESYAYSVGTFETEDEAQKFNEKFIQSNYPDAQIVRYKNGKRK